MSRGTNQRFTWGRIGFRTAIAAGITSLVLLGATGPVSAAELIGPDVAVNYADLDISTAAGAERLYERIQHAAAHVCPQADSQRLAEYRASIRCQNDVIAHAVHSISSPQLTALYTAHLHHGSHGAV